MPPTIANGKICYIEIPATDIARSAEFYRTVFGWTTRTRGDGSIAFDDGVGEVSGSVGPRTSAADAGAGRLHHGRQDAAATLSDRRPWRRDHAAHRRRRAGDHGAVPRSRRQRDRSLSAASLIVDRKALIREYKQAARPMGVYRVTDTVTGQSLVGWSLDLTARLNRHRAGFDSGAHPGEGFPARVGCARRVGVRIRDRRHARDV